MVVASPVLPPSGCCSGKTGDGNGDDDRTPNSFLTALATASDKDSLFDCVLLVAAFDLKSSSLCGPDNLFVMSKSRLETSKSWELATYGAFITPTIPA